MTQERAHLALVGGQAVDRDQDQQYRRFTLARDGAELSPTATLPLEKSGQRQPSSVHAGIPLARTLPAKIFGAGLAHVRPDLNLLHRGGAWVSLGSPAGIQHYLFALSQIWSIQTCLLMACPAEWNETNGTS